MQPVTVADVRHLMSADERQKYEFLCSSAASGHIAARDLLKDFEILLIRRYELDILAERALDPDRMYDERCAAEWKDSHV